MLNNHMSNAIKNQRQITFPSMFAAENYYNSPPLTTISPISRPQVLTSYSNYYTIVPPSPSYTTISQPPSSTSSSTIRFYISLQAQTAASQKADDLPLTYLNKGQYYTINLKDKKQYDGEIKSTIAISFHDENQRTSAADYWKYWLAQQNNASNPKAVELDAQTSTGICIIEEKQFDRVSFKWNGKEGATINVCFNCLSTDFSRIKGVKGIPLRLQVETVSLDSSQSTETTFCRVKLYRDKGAQRKNKDDAEHIGRQMRKLYNGDLSMHFKPNTSPVTLFTEIIPSQEEVVSPSLSFMPPPCPQSLQLPLPTSMKRSLSQSQSSIDYAVSAGVSMMAPLIKPPRRRRIAKLSLFVKFHGNDVYRAIYLECLTVKEFIAKISQRMEIKKPIANVFRKKLNSKRSLLVKVDDEVIQDLKEEQDMYIEADEHSDSIDLILNF